MCSFVKKNDVLKIVSVGECLGKYWQCVYTHFNEIGVCYIPITTIINDTGLHYGIVSRVSFGVPYCNIIY